MRYLYLCLCLALSACAPAVVVEPVPVHVPETLLATPSYTPLKPWAEFEALDPKAREVYLIQYAKSLIVVIGGYQQRVRAIRDLVTTKPPQTKP